MLPVLFQAVPAPAALVAQVAAPVGDPPASTGTWGVSSPDFVKAYAVLLAVTVVVGFAMRHGRDVRRDRSVRSIEDLSPYEIASLTNGPALVTVTAMWSLWRCGVLVVDNALIEALVDSEGSDMTEGRARSLASDQGSSSTTLSVGQLTPDLQPIEVALVALVESSPGIRPEHASRQLRRSDAMEDLNARLDLLGFVRADAVRRRMRVGVALVFSPMLLLGTVRLVAEVMTEAPAGSVVALLLASVGAFAYLVRVDERSDWGRRLVAKAERRAWRAEAEARASLAGDDPLIDEARALALLGVGVIWSAMPAMAVALNAPTSMVMSRRRVSGEGYGCAEVVSFASGYG